MTALERIAALKEGRLPDRVPVFCNLLEQGAELMGMTMEKYYSCGENVAEGQLKLQEHYGYDQLWGYHYSAQEAEILGADHTIFYPDGPPNVGQLIIKDYKDIDALSVDDGVFEHPRFRELLKTIALLRKERGDSCPVLTSVVGSVSLPPILMGMEKWLDLLYTGPRDKVQLLLNKCSEYVRKKTKIYLEQGVTMVAYFNPLGSAAFVTPAQFDKEILPFVKSDMAGLDTGRIVYFNGGGIINPLIPSLLENTSLQAFYINPMDSIKEARNMIAHRGLLAAAINDIPLINQSKQEIRAEVKRIMKEGAPGGGFIFGTLVMPLAVGEIRIRTMLEAAFEFGAY
jgi:uroporphyrinogen decarboxylase